jgi:DNA-binding protein HU-beta
MERLTPPPTFDNLAGLTEETAVNKRDLVEKMATDAGLTKIQAGKALNSFMDGVQASLLKGDRVTLVGFGTFAVANRKARRVRDPQRGIAVEIAERRVARFAPGLELKAAVAKLGRPALPVS